MKKITLFLSVIGFSAIGQTQRTVLVEEFTQASCGPCAQANPSFNKMLTANESKAVSIKYQTSWPGVDPMNAQNKTDVSKRVTYYDVQAVPEANMDGGATAAPSKITTTTITKEYGISSPFTLDVTQEINGAKDSIAIEINVGAADNFTTAGPFYLRVALVEKTITFSKAPGSNGEKEFYNVMRKMYPSALGTAMALKWTKGQSQKVSFKVPIPAYIYNKAQLNVVAFLQTDNDNKVQQAAKSINIITGVRDEASLQVETINIFPNPMKDMAIVSMLLTENHSVKLDVVNTLGQTVLSNNLGQLPQGEQLVELNTSSLKPGMYFLNICIGQQMTTKKITINY